MHDFISSLPTDVLNADQAYDAYWQIATMDNSNVAGSTKPIYRFAREYMLRTVAAEYGLTMTEIEWMYQTGPLCEGPGWGSVKRMVEFSRAVRFGRASDHCPDCLCDDRD